MGAIVRHHHADLNALLSIATCYLDTGDSPVLLALQVLDFLIQSQKPPTQRE